MKSRALGGQPRGELRLSVRPLSEAAAVAELELWGHARPAAPRNPALWPGLEPAHFDNLVRVRAETTKSRQERVVPYSVATQALYAAYLGRRRELSRERRALFLSESRRNRARPVTIWTSSKAIAEGRYPTERGEEPPTDLVRSSTVMS